MERTVEGTEGRKTRRITTALTDGPSVRDGSKSATPWRTKRMSQCVAAVAVFNRGVAQESEKEKNNDKKYYEPLLCCALRRLYMVVAV